MEENYSNNISIQVLIVETQLKHVIALNCLVFVDRASTLHVFWQQRHPLGKWKLLMWFSVTIAMTSNTLSHLDSNRVSFAVFYNSRTIRYPWENIISSNMMFARTNISNVSPFSCCVTSHQTGLCYCFTASCFCVYFKNILNFDYQWSDWQSNCFTTQPRLFTSPAH